MRVVRECLWRCHRNASPVSGPATTTYGAAAAMEEAQGDAGFAGHLVERAVRLPYLPGAGDHAAVLVGVGVAEHDLLAVAPGREQRPIGGGRPQLAADGGGVAQVLNGLEEQIGRASCRERV